MPSLKMKTNLRDDCLREKCGLHVCQKSNVISKKMSHHKKISDDSTVFDSCIQNCQDVILSAQCINGCLSEKDLDHQGSSIEENYQFQKQPSFSVNLATTGRLESFTLCPSDLETIFSPILEHIEAQNEPDIENFAAGRNNEPNMPRFGIKETNDSRTSSCYQTCDISDFCISDMVVSSLPFKGSDGADISGPSCFHDYSYADSSRLYDVADQYMILPFLEDAKKTSTSYEDKTCEEEASTDSASLCLVINQMKPTNQESDVNSDSDQTECFDPQLFINNLPELSDVTLPMKSDKRKGVTLVLDLDETLVHSTLNYCEDADFNFSVLFNMKEHTVCVKQRPYLHIFLERVAEMFEVVIFTASQGIYAEQVLNSLDPEGRLISRKLYRESCLFSEGSYTKDLTVLGVDLAKVVIIDNNPQVFRLQVNNGIPIKSWFDDQSDSALISLLPFLESLVGADDVRPIIAHRFGNKE